MQEYLDTSKPLEVVRDPGPAAVDVNILNVQDCVLKALLNMHISGPQSDLLHQSLQGWASEWGFLDKHPRGFLGAWKLESSGTPLPFTVTNY